MIERRGVTVVLVGGGGAEGAKRPQPKSTRPPSLGGFFIEGRDTEKGWSSSKVLRVSRGGQLARYWVRKGESGRKVGIS